MTRKTTTWRRAYPWGAALHLETIRAPGGLKHQVDKIRDAVGPTIGSRNTFAKLFDLDAPPDASTDPIDAQRARYLVAALGLDAAEWGVLDVPTPAAVDLERVLVLVGGGGAQVGRLTAGGAADRAADLHSRQSRCTVDAAGRSVALARVA